MSKRAHLQEITVHRMYGTPFGLHIKNLEPGINVICGPNGSGKTTIAHAIQTVLLRAYAHAKGATVSASLRIGDRNLHFNIDGSRRACTQNGRQIEGPSTPKLIRPDSYHFSLHDLLNADSQGKEFATAILREASGGFDISKAQEILSFSKPTLRPTKTSKALPKAQKLLRSVEGEQKKLFSEKTRCKDLEIRLQSAREAAHRVNLLEKALAWQTAQQAWQEASDALNDYPEVIRKATDMSSVVRDTTRLQDDVSRLNDRCRIKKDSIAELQEKLFQSPLAPNGLPEDVIQTAASRIARLRELDTQCRKIKDDLVGARKTASNAWADLGGAIEAPENLSSNDVGRLRRLTARKTDLDGKREALDALRSILKIDIETDLESESDRLRRTQDAVVQWIAAQRAPVPQWVKLVLIAAMVGSAILSIVYGLTDPPAFAGLAITLLVGLAYIRLLRTRTGSEETQAIRRIDSELADRLNQGDALEVLYSLLKKSGDVDTRQAEQRRWDTTSDQRDQLAAKYDELAQDQQDLAQETGLVVSDADSKEIYALGRLLTWREQTDIVRKLEGQYDHKKAAYESVRAELNAVFSQYNLPAASDVHEANAYLERLRSLDTRWKDNSNQLKRLKTEFNQINESLTRAERNYKKKFEDLNLEPGQIEQLRRYKLTHAEYLKAVEQETKDRAVLDQAYRTLHNAPGFTDALLQQNDLYLAKEDAQTLADQREDLQSQITKIRTEIERAERGNSLETALADVEATREDLAKERDENIACAVGEVLARRLTEHAREMQLPKVFRRAQQNFLKITHGQYALEFDLKDRFGAVDKKQNRNLKLDELSSGTRVQLLFSVRMAFVQEQELEYHLPITLDETLGNSDDERARIIMSTLSEVAKERQVFYFTAQSDEVFKWHQCCGDDINVIPLTDDVRFRQVDPDTLPQILPAIPSSKGLSHKKYGSILRPPRWSGRDHVNSIHLWYLLEDTTELERLLLDGVDHFGPAQALYSNKILNISEKTWKYVEILAKALTAWQTGWKVGRGKPVDQVALEASGAVSQHFMDKTLSVCKNFDGDGKDLLHALRNGHVRGFHTKKIDDLQYYLHEHGYLSLDKKRPDDHIRSDAVMAVASDLAAFELEHTFVNRMLERVATGPFALPHQ